MPRPIIALVLLAFGSTAPMMKLRPGASVSAPRLSELVPVRYWVSKPAAPWMVVAGSVPNPQPVKLLGPGVAKVLVLSPK